MRSHLQTRRSMVRRFGRPSCACCSCLRRPAHCGSTGLIDSLVRLYLFQAPRTPFPSAGVAWFFRSVHSAYPEVRSGSPATCRAELRSPNSVCVAYLFRWVPDRLAALCSPSRVVAESRCGSHLLRFRELSNVQCDVLHSECRSRATHIARCSKLIGGHAAWREQMLEGSACLGSDGRASCLH